MSNGAPFDADVLTKEIVAMWRLELTPRGKRLCDSYEALRAEIERLTKERNDARILCCTMYAELETRAKDPATPREMCVVLWPSEVDRLFPGG